MSLEDCLRRIGATLALLDAQLRELGTLLDRSEVGHWVREIAAMKQRLDQWRERGVPEVVRCEVLKPESSSP